MSLTATTKPFASNHFKTLNRWNMKGDGKEMGKFIIACLENSFHLYSNENVYFTEKI